MALNRLIDAELDARNPRTAFREIPAGRLGRREVWVFTLVSVALLVLAAFNLSEPCRYLWPIPLAAFVLYPYTKRFTWFCHYALGLTLGLAPAAAWVAVTGGVALQAWLLFFAVGLWVGGFDVIYAIFDLEFDRAHGLHSVPVAVGRARCPRGRRALPRRHRRPAGGRRRALRPRRRVLGRPCRGDRRARLAARRHRASRCAAGGHELHEGQRRRGPAVRRRRHRRRADGVGSRPPAATWRRPLRRAAAAGWRAPVRLGLARLYPGWYNGAARGRRRMGQCPRAWIRLHAAKGEPSFGRTASSLPSRGTCVVQLAVGCGARRRRVPRDRRGGRRHPRVGDQHVRLLCVLQGHPASRRAMGAVESLRRQLRRVPRT